MVGHAEPRGTGRSLLREQRAKSEAASKGVASKIYMHEAGSVYDYRPMEGENSRGLTPPSNARSTSGRLLASPPSTRSLQRTPSSRRKGAFGDGGTSCRSVDPSSPPLVDAKSRGHRSSHGRGGGSSRKVAARGPEPSFDQKLATMTIEQEEESKEESERIVVRKKKKKVFVGTWRTRLWNRFTGAMGVVSTPHMERADAIDAVRALCMPPSQLRKLKQKFEEVDLDRTGSIGTQEFFDLIGENRTPLTDYLFGTMDLDSSGSIEFDEFVAIVLNYCMFSREDILRFCYDSFDTDHSNSIDEREFTALLAAVNNSQPTFPGNFATALDKFDTNQDGLIDFAEFKNIDKRFPLILFPAFRLQDMMMKRTLGERAWRDIHARVESQRILNEYRRAHGGHGPPRSLAGKLVNFFSDKLLNFEKPPEVDVDLIEAKKPSLTSALLVCRQNDLNRDPF